MIGTRLNNYEIVSLLGEGGMGMVYLARHPFMGRHAAIKVLRPELLHDKSVVGRFMEEARATNAIRHPNIIDIIDVGFLPGTQTPYLMMEYLDGESLARRLERSRPLPLGEAIEIACQTASALEAAHKCQIVHRDLKPENLFLIPDQSRPLQFAVKVLDFGIAKLRGDMRARSAQTKSNIIMGTPFYMSPEQCRGLAAWVNPRSDIYSLGVIVYEMLCGRLPFFSEGVGEVIAQHITEAPTPLRTHAPAVPEAIERVVLRALAKDADQRFESMGAFAQALREATGSSGVDATGPTLLAPEALGRGAASPGPTSAVSTPGDTVARGPAVTTLSSMAGQLQSDLARPLRQRKLMATILIASAISAGAAAVVLWTRTTTPPPPAAAAAAAASVPPLPVSTSAMRNTQPASAAAPSPATIGDSQPVSLVQTDARTATELARAAAPANSAKPDTPVARPTSTIAHLPAKFRKKGLSSDKTQGEPAQQPALPAPPETLPMPPPKPAENVIRPGDRW